MIECFLNFKEWQVYSTFIAFPNMRLYKFRAWPGKVEGYPISIGVWQKLNLQSMCSLKVISH